ncbi:MAG: hypothetical protein AB8B83_02940 [Bdellovibrionales bacterium]
MFIIKRIVNFGNVFRVKPEGQNKEFWISQIVVILATVLGVYLAATEGFKLAIHFDRLSEQRDNYYLQKAFYDEISDNIETAESMLEKLEANPGNAKYILENHQFSLYIWNTMPEHNATFQIPTEVLNDLRSYYANNTKNREDIKSSWAYDANQARKRYTSKTDHIKTNTLPKLEGNILKLENKLNKNGFLETH